MTSSRFMSLAFLLLAGCDGSPLSTERVDFGAWVVAGYIIKAEAKCAAVGQPSIAECAELPRSKERTAAMTAQDTYKIFQDACYPNLGMSKCEGLIEQAYQEAKSR